MKRNSKIHFSLVSCSCIHTKSSLSTIMDTFPIHQSLSSFLLIVLLFFTPASSVHEYNQRFRDCLPTQFHCGERGVQLDINYPFWTEKSPENCRSPQELEMEIKCNWTDNSFEIVIQKRPYHVMTIEYEIQTATIIDKDYYLVHKDNPCHDSSSNTNLDFNILSNYTQRDLNLSFLYDCPYYPIPDRNHLYLEIPTSCPSDSFSVPPYFTFEEHITGPFKNCSVIQIPIHRTNKHRQIWLNPEEFWIVNVLAGGFEVSWSSTQLDHLCGYCFESNDHLCRLNETSNSERDCYCNGKWYPDECPPPPSPAPLPGTPSHTDHNTICLRPPSNTSLDLILFNFTQRDLNLSFLYSCSFPSRYDNPYFKFFNCSSDPLSSNYAYFTLLPDITGPFTDCKVVRIPILETNREELEAGSGDLNDILKEGFEVTWSLIDPYHQCWDCVKSNGHYGLNQTSPLEFACYCNGIPHPETCPLPGNGNRKKYTIIGAITGVGILIMTCCFVFILCLVRKLPSDNSILFWKKKTRDSRNVEAFLENYGSLAPKRYQYSELKTMTNSFKDNLGHGGYGTVFKGNLKDGRPVAVKVLNNAKGGNGDEFINEVASIGRTCHVNVVTLLGFCSEGTNRALVYEFMSKGSLEKFIFSDNLGNRHQVLDCQKLFQIAVGIARGLEYLHRGCITRIVHFDIKPHNILLDDDFCPKISDFGLAKLCPQQQSTLSMLDARGTIGYTAPEVFCRSIGGVSHKSDVYSYGMMVLEMIGGRKNIDAEAEKTSEIYFPHWVYKHIELNESLALLGFQSHAEEDIGRKMVLVGLWCIQTNPTNRPSMTKVVEMLEGSLGSLEIPPKPYLCSP